MIRWIKRLIAQSKERYRVPRSVQDTIPVKRIWPDGIFQIGNRYSMSWKFSDINYLIASREDKEAMFDSYSELLNGLDSDAVTKITLNNKFMKQSEFENTVFMKLQDDGFDEYRQEYNDNLLSCALDANGIIQEKYITVTVHRKSIEDVPLIPSSAYMLTSVQFGCRFTKSS